ncbi:hypothetical protein C8J57DRAFT_1282596 [Mycena rebaudengoi]|nr:hypothetical protein C8J57DRAFT_1282596 [Mycena rebaudengoi]
MPLEDAESTYAKAVQAELSKDFDAAFRLYIKAAESFLHLSRSVNQEKEKSKWKGNAAKALERAEKIKAFVERSKPAPSAPRSESTLTPVGVDYFSQHEQFYAVKKGGIINGRSYLLWDEPGPSNASPDTLYEWASAIWQRPVFGTEDQQVLRLRPQDILQHIITDCSVCASISFGVSSLDAFPRSGTSLQSPLVRHSKGRYDLRVLFNGAWRRVTSTSPLPTGALMCMSSAPVQGPDGPQHAMWPGLLEKGYMKLMGGYDFPGSNSSIDLHALVGWIPEHLEIKSPSFERETTWARIIHGFFSGQCMLTLGTGVDSHINWRGTHLLPSHSYAVIDVKEDHESRGFTVLDSWSRTSEPPSVDAEIRDFKLHVADYTTIIGILEIPWSEVLDVFDSVYLSWDPQYLAYRTTFPRQTGMADRPPNSEDEILILLSRHVQIEDDLTGNSNSGDQRTIATKGTFTNSTHVLYDGAAPEVGFTLSVYAPDTAKVAWNESVPAPPFSSKVEGTLTSKNAGGNSTYPTFMVNPQYHLRIHPPKHAAQSGKKANVSLNMQMGRDAPINIAVAWSQGNRIFELSQKDIAVTSGAYTYGSARVTKDLRVGDYTIILSAFEPSQMGSFSLEVESSTSFDLKPIPQEGAGMYTKTIRGAWNSSNAMGGPSFKQYSLNPIFEIDIQSVTELK